jgi:hypothetical protein
MPAEMSVENFIIEHERPLKDRREKEPMHIIDYDVRHKGYFKLPHAVCYASIAHILTPEKFPREIDPRYGVSDYLLLSEARSIMQTHVDFTGSSVCYVVARGRQIVHVTRPTQANMAVLDEWAAHEHNK